MFARVKHGLYKQRRVIVLHTRQRVSTLFLHSALSYLRFTIYSSLFRCAVFIWLRLPVFRLLTYCCCHFEKYLIKFDATKC